VKFTMRIESNNEAMTDNQGYLELAGLIHNVATHITDDYEGDGPVLAHGVVVDHNGNAVGHWDYKR